VDHEVVKILVDHRERAPRLIERLEMLGASIEPTALPVADYLVAHRVGVERKTVADLHRSLADRRLWTQIASLRKDLKRAYLVIEGRSLDRGCISKAGVRSALLTVDALGVVVLRSEDEFDSALWLWRIAARHRGAPTRVSRTVPHRSRGALAVLATVEGISPELARRLLDRFGSVGRVATATKEELVLVEGIGARRASNLRSTLANRS
jgi:DNA excision repair protein ERCC-4